MKKRYLFALLSLLLLMYIAVKPYVSHRIEDAKSKPFHNPVFYGIHMQDSENDDSYQMNQHSKFWGVPNINAEGTN